MNILLNTDNKKYTVDYKLWILLLQLIIKEDSLTVRPLEDR